MQSGQITIQGLPVDALFVIASHLCPEDAVRFFSQSKSCKQQTSGTPLAQAYWRNQLSLHFPVAYKKLAVTKPRSWKEEFIEAYKKTYFKVDRKLLSIVKQGDLFSVIEGQYGLEELLRRIDGKRVIEWAVINKHQKLLDYFYQLMREYFESKDFAESPDSPKCSRDSDAFSLLHWAAFCNQPSTTIIDLITQGNDVNIEAMDGTTPLHVAASCGFALVAKCLLEQNADPKAVDDIGKIPLHYAAEEGKVEAVECLLSHTDPNVTDNAGATSLHYAKDIPVVECLLRHNADINAKNKHDYTPIHVAAEAGNVELVERLLRNVDANVTSYYNLTVLHHAAEQGHVEVMECLLKNGANIHATDNAGDTALHCAVSKGRDKAVECLLKRGANPNALNNDGFTPLAMRVFHPPMLKTITRFEIDQYILERSKESASEYETTLTLFGYTVLTFGVSKTDKLEAACALKAVLKGADPALLDKHEKALSQGRLGKLYIKVKPLIDLVEAPVAKPV